ncbi:phosphate transport system permease protein [Haloechinothrix alba]|uniref:Phosphate transport system permease protein PstA n=1 Tax=Haloechinothrix alba TaxID=664784 RepID=A0A238VUN4_9PSEU|nr:phosphate ABC transporter permease PstA [Haloechinothrix alba]SNR37867.1 phosphate transport system permease protein [Haloechinothrix alba]
MSVPTRTERESDLTLTEAAPVRRTLPPWAPYAALAVAIAVGGTVTLAGVSAGLGAVLTVVLYVACVVTVSRLVEGPRKAKDRAVTTVVTSAFLLALAPLISVLATVISRGTARMDVEFFTFSMRGVVGEGGGVYHAITGTLMITGLATLISVPVGMLCGVYLVEYAKGRLATVITFFVDVMTGIPSIVAGLFAYALFALILGPGVRMGLMGAVALSVLMIPVVVRSTEEMLKLVPNELREAAYALAVPKWRMILKVVIPTALAGIATGVTLAIARVIGETAPLLVTVGITQSVNLNPFDGRMATLPVSAYYQYVNPGVPPDPSLDRAWSAALLLIIIVMALNLVARLISHRFAPKSGG